jgi:hypothetical protein
VAAVVDVEVDNQGQVRIPRVDLAVDAGRVMHPERVQMQFEGAAVFAASVALMGEITAANGQIQQSNYHDYPVARLTEAPYETHVHLLPSHDLPAGVGEPSVPPTIPALCNGKRSRGKLLKNQSVDFLHFQLRVCNSLIFRHVYFLVKKPEKLQAFEKLWITRQTPL